jgi:sugar phosphate isomerase/epimerase
MLDTFHMNIEEPSIDKSLRAAAGRAPYLHVVDSNRWAPGYGHIDFDEIARTLRSIEFSGYFSAEVLPQPDAMTAAKRSVEAYRKMIAVIES